MVIIPRNVAMPIILTIPRTVTTQKIVTIHNKHPLWRKILQSPQGIGQNMIGIKDLPFISLSVITAKHCPFTTSPLLPTVIYLLSWLVICATLHCCRHPKRAPKNPTKKLFSTETRYLIFIGYASRLYILCWIFCDNYWKSRGQVAEAKKLFACLLCWSLCWWK